MKRRALLLAGVNCAATARPALRQLPGAQLPLHLPFADSEGRALRLGDCFDGRRMVLLVPGYYRCPQLCGLVMQGLLQALQREDRSRFRIVRVSIDPEDRLQDARAQRNRDLAYGDFLGRQDVPLDLRALVGGAEAIGALASAIGFEFEATRGPQRFAHPATTVVANPEGRVTRYLPGLDFEGLHAALAGQAGFSDRLALLCAHVEETAGRHSALVLGTLRVLGTAGAAALAAACWRAARRRP